MKLERAVPCKTPPRLGQRPTGLMVVPGIVVSLAVAVATVIIGLRA